MRSSAQQLSQHAMPWPAYSPFAPCSLQKITSCTRLTPIGLFGDFVRTLSLLVVSLSCYISFLVQKAGVSLRLFLSFSRMVKFDSIFFAQGTHGIHDEFARGDYSTVEGKTQPAAAPRGRVLRRNVPGRSQHKHSSGREKLVHGHLLPHHPRGGDSSIASFSHATACDLTRLSR